jgi:cell division protein FtsW (lipid II flippase)
MMSLLIWMTSFLLFVVSVIVILRAEGQILHSVKQKTSAKSRRIGILCMILAIALFVLGFVDAPWWG